MLRIPLRLMVVALAIAAFVTACANEPEIRLWNHGATPVVVVDESGRSTTIGPQRTKAVTGFVETGDSTVRRLVVSTEAGTLLGCIYLDLSDRSQNQNVTIPVDYIEPCVGADVG